MKLSLEMERLILRQHGKSTRGNNSRELVIVASGPPHNVDHPGWTVWKNGRAKKYHRATYELQVGEDWLRAQFPATAMAAVLLGAPAVLQSADCWRKPVGPYSICGTCLDPDEDRLYAD